MDVKTHWDKVYATKAPESVSWYRAHLETSLALVERAAEARSASIIDIGGGESTLVDDLLSSRIQKPHRTGCLADSNRSHEEATGFGCGAGAVVGRRYRRN